LDRINTINRIGEGRIGGRFANGYASSAAAKVHLERNALLVSQIPTLATRLGFTIYGAPSDEVKQILSSRGAVIMKPLGGFSR
jgi:hypothetical protein